MKSFFRGNTLYVLFGLIMLLGLAGFVVQAMPWATKEQLKTVREVAAKEIQNNETAIKLLIKQRTDEQNWYMDFRERLVRIEESGKNISKDLEEFKSDFKDHQRNHHN